MKKAKYIISVFCPRAGLPLQTQEPRLQFYHGLNGCSSFPLLSTLHSLFSTWTDLKRSEKSPWAPTWRWGEWIWLTGPSRLHWNSPQRLNISSIRVFDPIRGLEIPITLHPDTYIYIWSHSLRFVWQTCDLFSNDIFNVLYLSDSLQKICLWIPKTMLTLLNVLEICSVNSTG